MTESNQNQEKPRKSKKGTKEHPLCAYTDELADWICNIVATHPMGLPKLYAKYKDQGFPCSDTIIDWRYKFPEFQEKFLNAKRFQALLYMEEAYDISDDVSNDLIETDKGAAPNSTAVARAKLRVDTRKWVVSRLLPKIYGEKTYVENKVTMSHEEMLKELE